MSSSAPAPAPALAPSRTTADQAPELPTATGVAKPELAVSAEATSAPSAPGAPSAPSTPGVAAAIAAVEVDDPLADRGIKRAVRRAVAESRAVSAWFTTLLILIAVAVTIVLIVAGAYMSRGARWTLAITSLVAAGIAILGTMLSADTGASRMEAAVRAEVDARIATLRSAGLSDAHVMAVMRVAPVYADGLAGPGVLVAQPIRDAGL